MKLGPKQRLAIISVVFIITMIATWQFRNSIILKLDFVSLVEIGDVEGVRMQLNCNPKLVATDCDTKFKGYLPIHHAARTGNIEMVKMLVELGSPLSTHDAFGWSPLHYAVVYEHDEVARLLTDSGAQWDKDNEPSEGNLGHQLILYETEFRGYRRGHDGPSELVIQFPPNGDFVLQGTLKVSPKKITRLIKRIADLDPDVTGVMEVNKGQTQRTRQSLFYVMRLWRRYMSEAAYIVDLNLRDTVIEEEVLEEP